MEHTSRSCSYHCLHSLFSVGIGKFAHQELFCTVVTELSERLAEYAVLTDGLANDSIPPELLSFLDQDLVMAWIQEIVNASPALEKDSDLSFRWQRLRGKLREANIYLGTNTIWIRPYIYPLVRSITMRLVTTIVRKRNHRRSERSEQEARRQDHFEDTDRFRARENLRPTTNRKPVRSRVGA